LEILSNYYGICWTLPDGDKSDSDMSINKLEYV
jgi:hypothetical protein